jgi:hypothetical protein
MANQAKKISQLTQKTNVDDADLFVIRDSASLDNRSISALDMKSYFGGSGSVDWANITNKPSTFPPSPHTHQLSDITDFPTGVSGDVFIHDGTNWQASDVVIIRNISWFQANANNVLRKNTVVFLQEDKNCFKIGDGVTTLKNLKWYIDRNYGDISITAHSGVFGKNTSTGKDVTHSIFGSLYGTHSSLSNNEFRGSFGLLPEPMTVEALGIRIATHSTGGGSVQLELAIYQPNFSTKINTLIAKTNLSPIVVGNNIFNLQTPQTLSSGVYFFALRCVVPGGSSFTFSYISAMGQILNVNDNEFGAYSYSVLSGQTSMPATCGFPLFANNSAYYFLISGQRILPTI